MNERIEKPSCFVIGLGSLCIRCVEWLLEHGSIEVKGVISADEAVINFGKSRGLETLHVKNKVRYAASKREIDEFLTRSSFDYFFSIINAMFLPMELIRLARKLAINFHDSELPKYAGIDAQSWVIMRQEPRHAVTWHVMSSGIDEGDIVKQTYVPIEPRETAVTLSEKCLDTGFVAFKELVEDLSRGTLSQQPQPAAERSYYSRSKPHLPEMSIWNHGVVSWQQSANEIEALTRALDYGSSRNSLGTAKIFIEGDFYILPSIEICSGESRLAPGTVVENDGKSLRISTSSRDVLVTELLTIDGRPMSITALSAEHDLAKGARLGAPPPDLLRAIKELDKDMMWKEAYWASELKSYVRVPALASSAAGAAERVGAGGRTSEAADVRLSEQAKQRMGRFAEDHRLDLPTLLFSGFASFLGTLLHTDVVPIWYSDEEYRQKVLGMTGLISPSTLCRARFSDAWTALDHYRQAEKQLQDMKKQGPFLYDIMYRFPQLRDGRGFEPVRQFAFVSHGADGGRARSPGKERDFEVSLDVVASTNELALTVRSGGGSFAGARVLADQLSSHIEAIMSSPGTPFRSNEHFARPRSASL